MERIRRLIRRLLQSRHLGVEQIRPEEGVDIKRKGLFETRARIRALADFHDWDIYEAISTKTTLRRDYRTRYEAMIAEMEVNMERRHKKMYEAIEQIESIAKQLGRL